MGGGTICKIAFQSARLFWRRRLKWLDFIHKIPVLNQTQVEFSVSATGGKIYWNRADGNYLISSSRGKFVLFVALFPKIPTFCTQTTELQESKSHLGFCKIVLSIKNRKLANIINRFVWLAQRQMKVMTVLVYLGSIASPAPIPQYSIPGSG